MVLCFVFLGNSIFISDQNINSKSNRNRNCTFLFPWESHRSQVLSIAIEISVIQRDGSKVVVTLLLSQMAKNSDTLSAL